jgi:hypothetical protein
MSAETAQEILERLRQPDAILDKDALPLVQKARQLKAEVKNLQDIKKNNNN